MRDVTEPGFAAAHLKRLQEPIHERSRTLQRSLRLGQICTMSTMKKALSYLGTPNEQEVHYPHGQTKPKLADSQGLDRHA